MAEPWSPYTKRTVVLVGLALGALLLWYFRAILGPLIVALLVAYVLSPLVGWTARRLQVSRTLASVLVYVLIIAVLLTLPAALVPILITQLGAINVDVQEFYTAAEAWLDRTVSLGQWSFNMRSVAVQVSNELSQLLSSLMTGTFSLVIDVAAGLLQGFFVLVISFYIVKDAPLINQFFDQLPPLSTRSDFRRLRQEIGQVWQAFLRGQLILCLVIGTVVTISTSILGLRSALALGLLAGALEFIPNLGPVIATIPAVLVALLNGSSWLPLSNVWFAILIVGLYIVIQQVENNYLVPRILGGQLNLHPLAVLIAVVAGASLAGVLGVFLAAPVLATLSVLGRYTYRKLQDQEPFPPASPRPGSPSLWRRLRRQLQLRIAQPAGGKRDTPPAASNSHSD